MEDVSPVEVEGVVEELLRRFRFEPADPSSRAQPDSSGLYVLGLADGVVYVGEAGNLRKRLEEHRRQKAILKLWLRLEPAKTRKTVETDVIQAVEGVGGSVFNIDKARRSVSFAVFDETMSREQQALWLRDPASVHDSAIRAPFGIERVRFEKTFRRFLAQPHAAQALEFLRLFTMTCLPAPKAIEARNMGVSCLPATGSGALLRVNVYQQEVAAVLLLEGGRPFYYVQGPTLSMRRALSRIMSRHAELELYPEVWYRAGGPDQGRIGSTRLRDLEALVTDEVFGPALREFNLSLVRRGGCLWGKSHCPQMLDQII
jgi:hypothetical protein